MTHQCEYHDGVARCREEAEVAASGRKWCGRHSYRHLRVADGGEEW